MKNLERVGPGLNAFKFRFEVNLLGEIRRSYNRDIHPRLTAPYNKHLLEGGRSFRGPFGASASNYYVASYGNFPLLWFSSNHAESYQIYKRFFDCLALDSDVKQLVNFDTTIIMYCGFLVIGNRAPDSSWHVDYQPGSNAYTLVTPLFEPATDHGNLLYKAANSKVATYRYALGEAVFFGEGFAHTTEKYERSNQLRVLVSLTFGTDKLEYWPVLKNTIGAQSCYFILPCGHPAGSCQCLDNMEKK